MKNVLKLYWRHTLNKVRNYCNTKTTTTFPYEVKNNITCFSIFKQNIWYGLRNSVEVYIFRSMHTKNLTKKKTTYDVRVKGSATDDIPSGLYFCMFIFLSEHIVFIKTSAYLKKTITRICVFLFKYR